MKLIRDGFTGLKTLSAFPVVLVTIGQNILTVEYCGTVSGRNVNKFEEADITPPVPLDVENREMLPDEPLNAVVE